MAVGTALKRNHQQHLDQHHNVVSDFPDPPLHQQLQPNHIQLNNLSRSNDGKFDTDRPYLELSNPSGARSPYPSLNNPFNVTDRTAARSTNNAATDATTILYVLNIGKLSEAVGSSTREEGDVCLDARAVRPLEIRVRAVQRSYFTSHNTSPYHNLERSCINLQRPNLSRPSYDKVTLTSTLTNLKIWKLVSRSLVNVFCLVAVVVISSLAILVTS